MKLNPEYYFYDSKLAVSPPSFRTSTASRAGDAAARSTR